MKLSEIGKAKIRRIIIVMIIFSMVFSVVGFLAPAVWAGLSPESNFIEVHSISASNATVNESYHIVSFNRTIHTPTRGVVSMELIQVQGDKNIQIIGTTSHEYFEKGYTIERWRQPLPSEINEGEYYYRVFITLELERGIIDRTFVYTSETFYIKEGSTPTNETAP